MRAEGPNEHAEFGASYWTKHSSYSRYATYEIALSSTKKWYAGLLRLIDRHLPSGGRHLDAGCGHGALVHLLAERGFNSMGFDTSDYIIAQAQAAAHRGDAFRIGNIADAIPFKGRFDLVTCAEVLEHLRDPVRGLENLASALNPSGCMVVTTPNLAHRLPWFDVVAADPTHVSVHEPEWWLRLFSALDLSVRYWTTYLPIPAAWRLGSVYSRWLRLGPSLGPGTLFIVSSGRWRGD